jgi:cathepsin F
MLKFTTSILLLHVCRAMQAETQEDHMLNDLFAMYVSKYGKSYATDEEWQHRKNLFKESHKEIQNINGNGSSHVANHNIFSDWTHDEYKRLLGTWNKHNLIENGGFKNALRAPKWLSTDDLPAEIDWRTKGAVT